MAGLALRGCLCSLAAENDGDVCMGDGVALTSKPEAAVPKQELPPLVDIGG